jgi:hypothetical protein
MKTSSNERGYAGGFAFFTPVGRFWPTLGVSRRPSRRESTSEIINYSHLQHLARRKYEDDFGRLLRLLTVNVDDIDVMTELGIQSLRAQAVADGIDLEAQKRAAIARCRRRIDAARHLYEDGDLSREEYLKRKETNEREIAHWQARTTETEKVALELTLCLEAIDRINQLWDISDDEDKQGMARNLFSYVVFTTVQN